MKNLYVLFVVSCLLVAACYPGDQRVSKATPATPTNLHSEETLKADTAGAIMITVGDSPEAIIFVSKTGNVMAVKPEACEAKPECVSLVESLSAAKRVNQLELKPHHVAPQKGEGDSV